MAKSKTSGSGKRLRPAMTPEARENQLISLAVDLAEKQLIEGTASSQVITHYLKLGSTREKLERQILAEQKKQIKAKTKQLRSAKNMEEVYTKALDAMRTYHYKNPSEDDESYEDIY